MVKLVEAYPKHALNPSRLADRDQDGGQDPKRESQSPSHSPKKTKKGPLSTTATRLRGSPLRARPQQSQKVPRGSPSAREGGVTDEGQPPPANKSRLHLHPPSPLLPLFLSRSGVSAAGPPRPGSLEERACELVRSASASQSAKPTRPLEATGDCCRAAPPSPAFHSLPSSRIQPTSNLPQGFISSHSLSLPPATHSLTHTLPCCYFLLRLSSSPPPLHVNPQPAHHHPFPVRIGPPSTPGKIIRGRRGNSRWL